jgi:hypothetical protein
LLALVSTYRYDGDEVNGGLAKSEAKIIQEAVRNGGTEDHGELTRILGTRSKAQLVATFNCFRDEHSTTVTKVRSPPKIYSSTVDFFRFCPNYNMIMRSITNHPSGRPC